MGSNPIADMSGWSHSGRRRKLALLPGVALTSTQVRMVSAPSLTCVTSNGYFPAAVSLPVVKGVDLRSTARKCAGVRTP